LFDVSFWIDLLQRTTCAKGMSLMLPFCLLRPCVVRRRKEIICSLNATTMVGYGFWFLIGLVLLRYHMVIYIVMLINFVLLEVSQRTLWQLLLLSGFRYYLLFGKIATRESSTITLIILKLFLKGLNFKCIGGWKRTSSCLILTTFFGDKTLFVVYRLLCNVYFAFLVVYSLTVLYLTLCLRDWLFL